MFSTKLRNYRVSVTIGNHRDKLNVCALSKRDAINKVLSIADYSIHRVTEQGKRHHWWSRFCI